MEEFLKTNLFPHDAARKSQFDLISNVAQAVKNKKNLIVHAPTGLGKTAATLSPALAHAIQNKQTVFFLTSRHTQHKIVIETLKKIREKFNLDFSCADIIGKKHMCIVPGIEAIYSSEFSEFCKDSREKNSCEFYSNSFKSNKPTPKLVQVLERLKNLGPIDVEKTIEICREEKVCPYYATAQLCHQASVVVTDYYYLFSENIRNVFFKKAEKSLSDAIIIVDEGHNLPGRIRELVSAKLSLNGIERAEKEAKKYHLDETYERIIGIKNVFLKLKKDLEQNRVDEIIVLKHEFLKSIEKVANIDELIEDFEFIASGIREKKKQSSIGAISRFLELWMGPDEGFARIFSKKYKDGRSNFVLNYRCLDPSIVAKMTIGDAHSVILMSGTLNPMSMYKEILGFDENTLLLKYESPFPKENRLAIIIPETSTKYASRTDLQYKKIAEILSKITNEVPGNSAVFFPSYDLLNQINKYFQPQSNKTIFVEQTLMSKNDKSEFLDNFKKYKNAVLLGAASGSFSEGIDLPGVIKCVVVVGLPLTQPDLETKELIAYYDKKFKKGWDYGYIFPALNKTIQAAGRAIRSEKDRGVLIFLDERYAQDNYLRCFPQDWSVKITRLYMDRIKEFFKDEKKQ